MRSKADETFVLAYIDAPDLDLLALLRSKMVTYCYLFDVALKVAETNLT